MQISTILPLLALAIPALTASLETRRGHWGPAEYYSLGCPTNTTKPYASQHEQTQVLYTFANEVFVHQQVALGYDTYVAVNFINHAPEVAAVGTPSTQETFPIHMTLLFPTLWILSPPPPSSSNIQADPPSQNGTAVVVPFQTSELKGGSVELQRVFVGADLNGTSYGTIHFKGNSVAFGVGAIAGIWRLIGTCLVEYWDVAAGVEPSQNPIAYF